MFFPICSVDVFCFSLACFLLKVIEIFSCINFIDFTHCSQAFEGDAELMCAVSARQKKLSSRVSGNNGDPDLRDLTELDSLKNIPLGCGC